MYRHLLLAVDGSPASTHVAEHAYELAAQLGSEVTVVHVLDDVAVPLVQYGMEPYLDVEAINPQVLQAQRDAARRLVERVAAAAPEGLSPSVVVAEAGGHRVGEVISQRAEDVGADLVVVGTHGHRGLSRVFLGSVADSVVRSATVPVTLVRHHEHTGEGGGP